MPPKPLVTLKKGKEITPNRSLDIGQGLFRGVLGFCHLGYSLFCGLRTTEAGIPGDGVLGLLGV